MAKSDVFYFYFYFFYLHPLIRIPKVQGTVDRVNSALTSMCLSGSAELLLMDG